MRRASWWRRLWRVLSAMGEEASRPASALRGAEADPKSRLLQERTLVIDSLVDEELASSMVAQLLWLEAADPKAGITLKLDSEGGEVRAVLALHDALVYLRCPVSLVGTGRCGGVCTLLLACGREGRRSMVARGVVELAPLRTLCLKPDGGGRTPRREELHQHLISLLSLYTGRSPEQLDADCEQQRRLSAHEALEYGLIDHVLPED